MFKLLRHQAVCLPSDNNKIERITRYSLSFLIDRVCINILKKEIPYLHSHPWNFVSIVLWGGYKETRFIDGKITEEIHKPGSIIYRKYDDFHIVTPLKDKAITLFFRSKPLVKASQYLINGEIVSDTKFWLSQGYSKEMLKQSYQKMYNSK
jgi:hypothetical protein